MADVRDGEVAGSFSPRAPLLKSNPRSSACLNTEMVRLAAWLEKSSQRHAAISGREHHDLDDFIGIWREDADFEAAQRAFAQVDEAT